MIYWLFLSVWMFSCMCVCVPCMCLVPVEARCQVTGSFETAMWALGTKAWSSANTAVLRAISLTMFPPQPLYFEENYAFLKLGPMYSLFCLVCFFLKYLFIYLFIMCTIFSFCMYVWRPEEGTRPHYRWLWATMWLLGIELRTFGRAGSALNLWAISPAPCV